MAGVPAGGPPGMIYPDDVTDVGSDSDSDSKTSAPTVLPLDLQSEQDLSDTGADNVAPAGKTALKVVQPFGLASMGHWIKSCCRAAGWQRKQLEPT